MGLESFKAGSAEAADHRNRLALLTRWRSQGRDDLIGETFGPFPPVVDTPHSGDCESDSQASSSTLVSSKTVRGDERKRSNSSKLPEDQPHGEDPSATQQGNYEHVLSPRPLRPAHRATALLGPADAPFAGGNHWLPPMDEDAIHGRLGHLQLRPEHYLAAPLNPDPEHTITLPEIQAHQSPQQRGPLPSIRDAIGEWTSPSPFSCHSLADSENRTDCLGNTT
jgi:hypothetical protein